MEIYGQTVHPITQDQLHSLRISYIHSGSVTFTQDQLHSLRISYIHSGSVTLAHDQLHSLRFSYTRSWSVTFTQVQLHSLRFSYIHLGSVTFTQDQLHSQTCHIVNTLFLCLPSGQYLEAIIKHDFPSDPIVFQMIVLWYWCMICCDIYGGGWLFKQSAYRNLPGLIDNAISWERISCIDISCWGCCTRDYT